MTVLDWILAVPAAIGLLVLIVMAVCAVAEVGGALLGMMAGRRD